MTDTDLKTLVKQPFQKRHPRGQIVAPYEVQFVRKPDPKYLPVLLYVYALAALPYLTWRLFITNWNIWYGPLVLVAEIYGIITTLLALVILQKIWIPIHRTVALGSKKVTTDIFITTYTEPLDVLEPTVIGATQIQGANLIFILDDGNRPEVRTMAERLGVGYYGRTTNEHAKAGNLNNGLQHSKAKFVLTLDADHVPTPQILERTLGYFDDSKVAFVQSPQAYYNHDSFLYRRRGNGLWSEQQMFYDVIQVAKNRWNSAFFVGTSAVLRRSALDDVGGFATGTATEDIHTSLRLHAKGWKSIFVPEVLAQGLEAANLKEFYKQRRRWAAGSLGLLFRSPDSPLRARGLSLAQRINYLGACLAHLQGIQKVIFFLVPPIALFTLVGPVTIDYGWFNLIFAGYLLLAVSITALYARRSYHFIFTEAYSLANSMAHFSGLWGVIKVQKKFAVSKKIVKRKERTNLKLILWMLSSAGFAAIAQGIAMLFGWGIAQNRSGLVISSLIFCIWNVVCLTAFFGYLLRYERKEMTTSVASDFTTSLIEATNRRATRRDAAPSPAMD